VRESSTALRLPGTRTLHSGERPSLTRPRVIGIQIFRDLPAFKSNIREWREAESLKGWYHMRLPALELPPHFAPKVSDLRKAQCSQAVQPDHGAGCFGESLLGLIAEDQLRHATAGHGLLRIVGDLKQFIGQHSRLLHRDSHDCRHNEDRAEFSVGLAAQRIDEPLEIVASPIDGSELRSALQPAKQDSTRRFL
jgi:hypothetical protein